MTKRKPARAKPVLIVQHARHEHPAAILRALESQGIRTQWIHPYRGDMYPSGKEIAGLISLGGPMGANDDSEHPWISEELELIRRAVDASIPTVGICLGGQLIARALGGRVEKHHTAEVGWFPIRLNAAGRVDPVLGPAGKSPIVYHWHGDTFHLPPGAELLAKSGACPRQAYRIGGNVYGFQFHPEADRQLVLEWLDLDGVSEEILLAQNIHGTKFVQDAAAQREKARHGEEASLKLTAGIAGLFRRKKAEKNNPSLEREVREALIEQTLITASFAGSEGKPVLLTGKIVSVLKIPAGVFAIFRHERSLLWPIRLEDIIAIKRPMSASKQKSRPRPKRSAK